MSHTFEETIKPSNPYTLGKWEKQKWKLNIRRETTSTWEITSYLQNLPILEQKPTTKPTRNTLGSVLYEGDFVESKGRGSK